MASGSTRSVFNLSFQRDNNIGVCWRVHSIGFYLHPSSLFAYMRACVYIHTFTRFSICLPHLLSAYVRAGAYISIRQSALLVSKTVHRAQQRVAQLQAEL